MLEDVDRIEIIKEDADASIYGVRAMHGVVAVYSKAVRRPLILKHEYL
jgi:outer membrane cobalamin receptor